MMKTFSLTLFFLCSIHQIFAQFPVDSKTGKVKYSNVINLDNQKKKELYDKAKLWIVSTLKSGDNMVELDGTSSDQIVGTGNLILDSLTVDNKAKLKNLFISSASLNFKFILFVKDSKIKYSLENIEINYAGLINPLSKMENRVFNKQEKRNDFKRLNTPYINREIKRLIQSFTDYMRNNIQDDW